MRIGIVAAVLVACGSGPDLVPPDRDVEFTVGSLPEHLTVINCYGVMHMQQMRVHATCQVTGEEFPGDFGLIDTFEATIEEVPNPYHDEQWFHFHADPAHYPVSQGMPMAVSLKPADGGWQGMAVYYPADAYIGYMDRPVSAHVH
jgi:hypothetical protein